MVSVIFISLTPMNIEIITKKTGLSRLTFAEKINKSTSDEFWTVCQGYHTPIDTIDGLIIDGQENLYPWQEPLYVSIEAALKRKNKQYWGDIAEVEKEYFEKLNEVTTFYDYTFAYAQKRGYKGDRYPPRRKDVRNPADQRGVRQCH